MQLWRTGLAIAANTLFSEAFLIKKAVSVFFAESGEGALVHGASKNVLRNEIIFFFAVRERANETRTSRVMLVADRRDGALP
ncbi:MAG TPA: hypothetical protein VLT33_10525 [Labilithrix sp.]|nr:hypothetical protein [Labilithrix sp.]